MSRRKALQPHEPPPKKTPLLPPGNIGPQDKQTGMQFFSEGTSYD